MALISGLGFRYLFGGNKRVFSGCVALVHLRGLYTGLLTKLFVGGLSWHTNDQTLKDTFSRYGHVVEASVMVDPKSGRSKGYGFVHFGSETEANNAIKEMDKKLLDGRHIFVGYAKLSWKNVCDASPRAVGPLGVSELFLEVQEEMQKRKKKKK